MKAPTPSLASRCRWAVFVFASSLLVKISLAAASPIENVVVIIGDDHAFHVNELYAGPESLTPNLDRLASEGVSFKRAYCNSPICSASRQSLLTGKYPYATGVNLLFTPFPDEGNVTIAEHLRDRGYATALIGKSHFNNWTWSSLYKDGVPDHGFDTQISRADHRRYLDQLPIEIPEMQRETYDRSVPADQVAEKMNWRRLPHAIPSEHSIGTYFVKEAAAFLERNRNRPTFLWLAFYEPHQPFHFPPEYADRVDPSDIALPSASPEDIRWIPEKYRNLSDEEKRGIVAAYCTSTAYLDSNIGLMLDELDRRGLADTTLVVYLSDNGYLLNDHGRFEKHTLWEEAVRMPTVFRGPGLEPNEVNSLFGYVDVAPTILGLLDAPELEDAQGISFAEAIRVSADMGKPYVFSTYLEDNMAMIRTERWKYVFTTGSRDLGISYRTGKGPTGIVHRLYDMQKDPRETRNLAGDPEHDELLQALKRKMIEHFRETHPDASDCPENLTDDGKLVWFCEPRDIGADQSLIDAPVRVFYGE